MKINNIPIWILFIILILPGCRNRKKSFVTTRTGQERSVNLNFGKTPVSEYRPEVRENMKRLYHDKIGLFVHFGPYAQLEGIWNGKQVSAEWIMKRAEIPVNVYEQKAAALFKPDKFNADEWIDIAKEGGMGFMVVTAKHHDGFAMFKSANPYNLYDFAGFHRDLIGELSKACSRRDMKFGFYYSQSQDWHEEGGEGNDWDFSKDKPQSAFDAYFQNKVVPQVKELTSNYGDIFMVWFDTPRRMDDAKCEQMMKIVKEHQPGALVNSRLGNGYGHFDVSIDRGMMPNVSKAAWLPDLKVPWQTHESVTLNGWGYTSYGGESDRSEDYTQFIYDLCHIVSHGGVILLNVGPRPDGTIPPPQVNTLHAVGDWLKANGESIYDADPSPLKFPPFAITSKPGKIYLHLKEVQGNQVELKGILSPVKKAYCLADPSRRDLDFNQKKEVLTVNIPEKLIQPHVTVVVLEIPDKEARVMDETIQQNRDGSIQLPVAHCEYSITRIGYDYDEKATYRWGENRSQRLIWTVNVNKPGVYRVISADNGDPVYEYQLITSSDTLLLNAKGETGVMSRKEQEGTIRIDQRGVQQIWTHPVEGQRASKGYKFKGLELVRIK